jgi:hypothetical protein
MTRTLTSIVRLSLATLVLWVSAHASANRFDDLWSDGRQLLEEGGITKPMFRSLLIWSEGQYFLGYCASYLPDADVAFWRRWWERTIVPRSDVGRQLLQQGADAYAKGANEAKSLRPEKELCRRVLDDWSADMDAANTNPPAK